MEIELIGEYLKGRKEFRKVGYTFLRMEVSIRALMEKPDGDVPVVCYWTFLTHLSYSYVYTKNLLTMATGYACIDKAFTKRHKFPLYELKEPGPLTVIDG